MRKVNPEKIVSKIEENAIFITLIPTTYMVYKFVEYIRSNNDVTPIESVIILWGIIGSAWLIYGGIQGISNRIIDSLKPNQPQLDSHQEQTPDETS